MGKVPADQIYWETGVRCLGGRIQRKIEYTPTCPVEFDQPNWLVRSLPVSKVVPARDEAHANQMIEAKGMAPILGTELSERMVKGQVGIGMPYGLFRYAFPDLKGCQGRALLNRHVLNGGQVDFACVLDGVAFHFTDLQLVWMGPPDELGKPPSADDEDVIE